MKKGKEEKEGAIIYGYLRYAKSYARNLEKKYFSHIYLHIYPNTKVLLLPFNKSEKTKLLKKKITKLLYGRVRI